MSAPAVERFDRRVDPRAWQNEVEWQLLAMMRQLRECTSRYGTGGSRLRVTDTRTGEAVRSGVCNLQALSCINLW